VRISDTFEEENGRSLFEHAHIGPAANEVRIGIRGNTLAPEFN
jgi:hypothetical protein